MHGPAIQSVDGRDGGQRAIVSKGIAGASREYTMAHARRTEQRLLTAEEQTLVDQTRQPHLADHSDADLRELVKNVRDRRDRAKTIADQQRREMRGKSAPSGARAATDNSGTRAKAAALASAVKRVNKEVERRRSDSAKSDLTANAERALAMKRAHFKDHYPDPDKTDGKGMRKIPNRRAPNLANPMEVGRVQQFVADAQAKRDSR